MSQIEIHAALELVLTLRFLRMLAARAYSRAAQTSQLLVGFMVIAFAIGMGIFMNLYIWSRASSFCTRVRRVALGRARAL